MGVDIDADCVIVTAVVMNSTTRLRAFMFVQGREVERVTKHPPGRTNFASDVVESLLLLFTSIFVSSIFVSSTINPS